MIPAGMARFLTAVLLAAAGLAGLIFLLAPWMPQPDPAALSQLLPEVAQSAAPEPAEMALYAIACIAAIPFAGIGWYISGKIRSFLQRTLAVSVLAGMMFSGFAPDGWRQLFHPLAWYAWFAAALAAGALCLRARDRAVRRRDWPVMLSVMGFLLLVIAVCRIHVPARMDDNFDHHIDILLYAFNAASFGMRDMHLYGFHPLFLKPFFIGGCSMLKTSLVLNGLFIAAFWCFWDAGRSRMRSRILQMFFGFAAVMVCGSGYFFERFGWMRIDPYFVYWPIRFFFPALCLNWVWHHRPSFFAAAVIAAAALWFNPETGIAVSGAFFVMYLLTGPWGSTLLYSLLYLAAVPLWSVILRIVSGVWPDAAGYLRYMQPYRQAGCMMLPLPQAGWHAWYFMAAVLLAALLWGMRCRHTANGRRLVFTAVLGAGIFSYYIGRSHMSNLLSVSYPVLLLLFVWSDRVLRQIRCRRLPAGWCVMLLPVLLLGTGALMLPVRQYRQTWLGLRYTFASLTYPSRTDAECMAVLKLAGRDRTVNIWPLRHQGIFYAENHLRPGIANFSLVEMVTRADRERVMKALRESRYPLIVTGTAVIPPEIAVYYELAAELPEYGVRRYEPRRDMKRAAGMP